MLHYRVKSLMAWVIVLVAPRAWAFPPLPVMPQLCKADQIHLDVDSGNGYFNGMSQSGMFLALKNMSSSACMLPARPELVFEDAGHHVLQAIVQTSPGMHPGPVILPIRLKQHETVVSQVRWVSGEVYDHSRCIHPTYVALRVGEQLVRKAFHGQLCGPQEKGPSYKATFFGTDNRPDGQRAPAG